MDILLPFSKETLSAHLNTWISCVERSEVCSILSVPVSGRPNRIHNIEQELQLRGISYQLINLESQIVEDPADIKRIILSSTQCIIITPAEKLLRPDHLAIAVELLQLQRNQKFGLLLFFDCFLYQIEQLDSSLCMGILQNVDHVPLLDEQDARQFVRYLATKWALELPDETVDSIIQIASGHTWLLKELVRQYCPTPDLESIQTSTVYQFKISKIWETIDSAAQNHLLQILHHSVLSTNAKVGESLRLLGFLDSAGTEVPTFIAEAIQRQQLPGITLQGKAIICGQIDITNNFSKLEKRLLSFFILNKDSLVSRENTAQACWLEETENKFTDWALDQVIKRLRCKLFALNGVSEELVTIKNKGYVFRKKVQSATS